MDYVSLLPPEIKKRRLDERRQAKILRIAAMVFVILLVINAFLLATNLLIRSNLQSLREEREEIERQAEALAEYEQLYLDMTAAEEMLDTAMGTMPEWHALLLDIGTKMPTGIVWFSDLSLSYSEEEGTFNLDGWGYSHDNVAELLERIKAMEQLEDIRTQTSTETTFEERRAVQFTLEAVVLPGPRFTEEREGDQ